MTTYPLHYPRVHPRTYLYNCWYALSTCVLSCLHTNADPRSHCPALTSSHARQCTILLASHTRSRARSRCRAVRRITSQAGPLLMVSHRDGVPLQSLGASLTFVFPAAFAAFPSYAVAALSPRACARITAAGPLFSALLGLALTLPLDRLFLISGYSNIAAEGLMVTSVSPESPLASHLPLGALLTALDDLPLAGAKEIAWREYLISAPSPDFEEPAWCVDTKWFLSGRPCQGPIVLYANGLFRIGHPRGCCAFPPRGPGSDACLVPLSDEETPRCTNVQELLVPTTSAVTRCEGLCTNGQMCVRLRGGEEFLRISAQSADYKSPTRVVLWRGARDEIYQGGTTYSVCVRPSYANCDLVDVTRWRPRSAFLPLWFPNLAAEIVRCVFMVACSEHHATEARPTDTFRP